VGSGLLGASSVVVGPLFSWVLGRPGHPICFEIRVGYRPRAGCTMPEIDADRWSREIGTAAFRNPDGVSDWSLIKIKSDFTRYLRTRKWLAPLSCRANALLEPALSDVIVLFLVRNLLRVFLLRLLSKLPQIITYSKRGYRSRYGQGSSSGIVCRIDSSTTGAGLPFADDGRGDDSLSIISCSRKGR
jgi:hypothetical protein